MTQQPIGLFRQETNIFPYGRIAAVQTPDGAHIRLELFRSGAVVRRPMRDFAQAQRCARSIALQFGGNE